ncbi:MAG: triose-phosphate isomerase [Candidatus Omnitrophica bacterium]|nr:triose-phosphate isomerase [Candidatus Omnitrophota bacterium]
MRKPLIAGNWKMYKTSDQAVKLVAGIKAALKDFESVDVVLCPPFTVLSTVYNVISDCDIQLGGQDLYWEKEGAFTGEISPIMLKDCGCDFVILGHSERRKYFAETDGIINKKVKAALEVGLRPICCVGETLEEREAGKTIDVVKTQLTGCSAGLEIGDALNLVIAYEPVWAIGTGKNATAAQAQEVHKFIRTWIAENLSQGVANSLRILYGGSVKPANTKELMNEEDVDGALVGGASLEASSFVEIVKNSI